jgi:hypothetical protein
MSTAETEREAWEGWAILELMGHRKLAGFVSRVEIAGAAMLRLDVPGDDGMPGATQFYAPASIYCLTPTTEEIARGLCVRNKPAPVTRWELPSPKPENEPEDFSYHNISDEDEDDG